MPLRAAILHPVALALLVLSLGAAGALATLPLLYPWSGQAGWMILWGIAAFSGVVVAVRLLPPTVPPPRAELRALLRVRDEIASRLQHMRQPYASRRRVELESVLEDALRQIDDEIVPAMKEILEREADLSQHLVRYERHELPLPEPAHLERLREIHLRERKAMAVCVQEAANAEATLEAILQEGDDTVVGDRARLWANDLLVLHDELRRVIQQEEVRPEPAPEAVPQDRLSQGWPAPPLPPVRVDVTMNDARFFVSLEEALRRLNDLGLLAQCALVQHLRYTLTEALRDRLNGQSADPSPLEQAQALHRVLIDGIEGLRPSDRHDAGAPESLQYHILHEEYVEGLATKAIVIRHSISESTLHRYRRHANEVLAGHLMKQEERLARDPDAGVRLRPRV